MKKTMAILLIGLLLMGLAVYTKGAFAAETPAKPMPAIDDLFKACDLEFTKDPEGFYKVFVSAKNDTTKVIAEVKKVSDSISLVYLYVMVFDLPENFQPSPAMLKKFIDLSTNLPIGKICLEKGCIYYNSVFWLNGATPEVVDGEMYFAHLLKSEIKKELTPFMSEQ